MQLRRQRARAGGAQQLLHAAQAAQRRGYRPSQEVAAQVPAGGERGAGHAVGGTSRKDEELWSKYHSLGCKGLR